MGYKAQIENVKNIEENENSSNMKIINIDINFFTIKGKSELKINSSTEC